MAKTYEAAVLPQQSWLDVVQTATGSISGLVDICYKNDISATAETQAGETIAFDEYDMQNRRIVQFFRLTPPPATGYVKYYEEFQWLKAGGAKLYLDIPESEIDVTFKVLKVASDSYDSLMSLGEKVNTTTFYEILARKTAVRMWIYNTGVNYTTNTEYVHVVVSGDMASANGKILYTAHPADLWHIGNFNTAHKEGEYLISPISNRYYPCRLVRALPASKSWDGKPHQAGECGMWDKVSDRFYGNAGTQGNFEVANG